MSQNINLSSIKRPSIFIVSSGRSGSNLLISILNASKQVSIPRESDFIARAYPFFKDKKVFKDIDYQNLVKVFMRSSRPRGWGMTESYLLSYLKEHKPQTYADVDSMICAAYHNNEGTNNCIWGIKAPVLIASIDRIFSVYPDAKILHIVRDGRDVCLSYQNIHTNSPTKFGPKSLITNALYWVDGLRRIEEFKSNQIHEIRYEDLVAQPASELSKICEFINIKYQDRMYLNFYALQANKNLFSDNISKNIHSKIGDKLDSSNVQKYKFKMPKLNRFIYELIASPYLEKYNFEREFSFSNNNLLAPLRSIAFWSARQINNWRYNIRDRKFNFD